MKRIAVVVVLLVCLNLFCSNANAEIDYMVLVTRSKPLPSNWEEIIDLVPAINVYGEEILLEKLTLARFYELREELLRDGIDIELVSGFKSYSEAIESNEALINKTNLFKDIYQKNSPQSFYSLLHNMIASNYSGEQYELFESNFNIPGCSEHYLGLAVDFCLIKDGEPITDRKLIIQETEILQVIREKLCKYGFIMRYPDGKKDITGYDFEPWHIRFINDSNIAKQITQENITLEEYLAN